MAEEAERLVLRMARSYVLPSMVTTHNIGDLLNVDIGGGLPALIAEILVQSSPGLVALLPAIPRRWRSGHVTDLHCRGQVVVSELRWNPDSLQAVLSSPVAQHLSVRPP
jgi:alpha-L-fucosidase 2